MNELFYSITVNVITKNPECLKQRKILHQLSNEQDNIQPLNINSRLNTKE